MFSSRTFWELKPNQLSKRLSEKRQQGSRVLDLTESNPTRAEFCYPDDLLPALACPKNLLYEPMARGIPSAIRAVVTYYQEKGIPIPEEQIFLASGTSECYSHLFRLLGNPGDQFLAPQPGYPLFEFLAKMESINLDYYPLAFDGIWHIDFEELGNRLSPATRSFLLVHPNNPTGSYIKGWEQERLLEICRARSLALIVDEVFTDYALNKPADAVDFPDGADSGVLTFVLNGLSKVAALPQMKLAWIAVTGPPDLRGEALERLELIHDTFLSVSTPMQQAAPAFFQARRAIQPQIVVRLHRNLQCLSHAIQGSAAQLLPVEGGWYAVVQVPRLQSEESWILGLLEEEEVLVHPGYFFDFPQEAYLVFSLLTPPALFDEGLQRFCRYLNRLVA